MRTCCKCLIYFIDSASWIWGSHPLSCILARDEQESKLGEVDECIFASCLLLLFCIVVVGSRYFTAFARTFYVCFHQDQDIWWIQWTLFLDQSCRREKEPKTRKIVNLELTNNSRRKPTAKEASSRSNDQLYGRTNLVRLYSYTRIAAISAAFSNSFVPWNWIGETTYRTPRNHRNLISGRDPSSPCSDLEGQGIDLHQQPLHHHHLHPSHLHLILILL